MSGGFCGVEGGTMMDFSAFSRKKQPAVERKNIAVGIGGGEDGSE